MAKRLTIVAGSGGLVKELAREVLGAGWVVQLVDFSGDHSIDGVKRVKAKLGNPLLALAAVKLFRPSHICLVGSVSLTPEARKNIGRFFEDPDGEDGERGDAALSDLGEVLAKVTGTRLIGVHELAPRLLASEGHMAGPEPGAEDLAIGRYAFAKARGLGALDIGQALVCAGRHVVAAEDITGTDTLLVRVAGYLSDGILEGANGSLVLAKAAKPQQTETIDMPAIGPGTITNAKNAGVGMIVVEAGRTLMIGREALFAAAERENVTLVGLTANDD